MPKPRSIDAPPIAQWQIQLSDGLDALGLTLSPTQQQQLLDYLALLLKWNRVFNLTAVRDPGQMVARHLLDSLAIVPWVRGPRVLDVGTGAGLPGIPLAIALPEFQFVLLDSNGKKTRFVQQAVAELGLPNVSVEQARVEAFRDARGFDTITSRAFADIDRMLDQTAHLRAPGGQWAAMKAGLEELHDLKARSGLAHQVIPLTVPGEAGRRHLVLVGEAGRL
ncbi:MAG: 16S rRNA (guanine(527)-N(7))-methyltransferase RsmG [Gammaproteobacteria bacterium]|nr:MAG: 16S rRNA (guanine(527)-N(7))-methyltransferase RsmG [Gammaproteobacteria bacterium]